MKKLANSVKNSSALVSLGLAGAICIGAPAMALPRNGQVVGGSATITQTSPTQLTINQASNSTTINWQSFSIGKSETTIFVQPNANSVAFNRVTGLDPSVIEGHLNANGTVVLVNPNGMLFTQTATVNVGSLVGSTSGISQANAVAGKMIFDQGSAPGASIVNAGSITATAKTAKSAGLVALVSPTVVNQGTITAKFGKVALASGDKWVLDYYGDRLVQFAVDDGVAGSVTNSGTVITGYGGSGENSIQLSANVAAGVLSDVINMSGVLQANGIVKGGGNISLVANGGVIDVGGTIKSPASEGTVTIADSAGDVKVTGSIVAGGQYGGDIMIKGQDVALEGATINAGGGQFGGYVGINGNTIELQQASIKSTGSKGGGTVDIGNAETTAITMDSGSVIDVNGTEAGSGGDVNFKASQNLSFAGTVDARGGPAASPLGPDRVNGGRVVMTAPMVDIKGGTVDVSAPQGKAGKWIIDTGN